MPAYKDQLHNQKNQKILHLLAPTTQTINKPQEINEISRMCLKLGNPAYFLTQFCNNRGEKYYSLYTTRE